MAEHMVVCIGRQFGSGGHEVAEKLAKQLGIPCYDKEILRKAAQDSGVLEELFEKADEKASSGFMYPMSMGLGGDTFANYNDYLTNDKLFLFQTKTIKEMADKESCIFVGRCADYILRGYRKRLSVFIHAPMELRIQRIARMYNIPEDEARARIKKTDKSRANYYSFYASEDWGAASTYDVCVNAGKLGVEQTVSLLCGAAEHLR